MFRLFGPASFIPVEKIKECAYTCNISVNDKVIIAVNPMRRVFCNYNLYITIISGMICAICLFHMLITFHLYLNIGKLKANMNYDTAHMCGKCGANINVYATHM